MYSNSMERKRTENLDPYQNAVNRRNAEKPMDLLNMTKMNESFNSSFDRQKGQMSSSYTANDYDHVSADTHGSSALRTEETRNEFPNMFKNINESNVSMEKMIS